MLDDRSTKTMQPRKLPSKLLHITKLRIATASKLVERHFTLKVRAEGNRKNSAQCHLLSHHEILEELSMKPLFLDPLQNSYKARFKLHRLPLEDINPNRNSDSPRKYQLNEMRIERRAETSRATSARKFIEPKVLKSRAFSCRKKRILSADQRKDPPMMFTFGKGQFS